MVCKRRDLVPVAPEVLAFHALVPPVIASVMVAAGVVGMSALSSLQQGHLLERACLTQE